ncbi:hypothetical protein D9M71_155730 [compost metagenome]
MVGHLLCIEQVGAQDWLVLELVPRCTPPEPDGRWAPKAGQCTRQEILHVILGTTRAAQIACGMKAVLRLTGRMGHCAAGRSIPPMSVRYSARRSLFASEHR